MNGYASPTTVATAAHSPSVFGGGQRLTVGIGEFAVSDRPGDVIVTHALGSCVAVCLFDPVAKVAGLIHVLLPEARINPARATEQPAAFADSGIPLLFESAYRHGAQKKRIVAHLIGGAEIAANAESGGGSFNIGRRNTLAAKNILWKNGVLIKAESVGGTLVRTVNLAVTGGRIQVTCGRETLVTL
jgi:chemotaxis protein CheD